MRCNIFGLKANRKLINNVLIYLL